MSEVKDNSTKIVKALDNPKVMARLFDTVHRLATLDWHKHKDQVEECLLDVSVMAKALLQNIKKERGE